MKVCGLFTRLMIGLLVFTGMALAQGTTGSIIGTVGDATGAVIPGATVTLRNVETGITRTVNTDAEGRYRAQQLGLGSYEVTSESAGFQTSVRTGITLTVGREATVDFAMQIGAVSERITVTGEAPLIETTNATVATLVDEKQVRELPLSGRSYTDLTAIQPGAIFVTTVTESTRTGGGRKISVNGARPQQSQYLMDGVETMNVAANMAPSSVLARQLGTDTIREFNVLTNNYGAQYGRAIGGVVNAVTRSGENDLHGSAFEFLRNDKLDADHYFVGKTPLKQNQFGGTFGGPITRDKSFYFLSYEGERQRKGTADFTAFMDEDARDGVITDPTRPYGTYKVDPSAILRGSACGLAATALCDFRPQLATSSGRWARAMIREATEHCTDLSTANRLSGGRCRYISSRVEKGQEDYGMARVDYNLSSNNSFFGRVTADKSNNFLVDLGNDPDWTHPGNGHYVFGVLQLTSILTPALLNVASVGFTRTEMAESFTVPSNLDPILSCIPGSPICTSPGVSGVGISGIHGADLSLPFRLTDNTFIYQSQMSYSRGKHSMSFGAEVKRYQMNEFQNIWFNGQMRFSSGFSRWYEGRPSSITGPIPQSLNPITPPDVYRGYRQTYVGLYYQDDIQVLPNLTFNLGVRWEDLTDPIDVNGKAGSVIDVLHDSGFTLGKVFEINSDWKGISPRLGFAYTPFGGGSMGMRGGFGVFTEWPLSYSYTLSSYVAPFADRVQLTNPTMPFPYSKSIPGDPALASTRDPIVNAYDWHPAYGYQWNFGIEQQLMGGFVTKVAYVGTRNRHLYSNNNPNQRVPVKDAQGRWYTPANAKVPNPNFCCFRYIANSGDAWYNSLQSTIERRFEGGLGFRTSFTWAKNLDTAGIGQQTADSAGSINNQNVYDIIGDKGFSQLHAGRSLTVTFNYEVPLGQGKQFANNVSSLVNHVVGGWQVNGVIGARDGQPLNATTQLRCSGSGVSSSGTDRPDLRPGASNNPVLDSRADFRKDDVLYFDPKAFVAPPSCFRAASTDVVSQRGYFGNAGRQTIIGPGLVSADLSFFKNFQISEGKALQFRTEIFNITNRPNFRLDSGATAIIEGARSAANPDGLYNSDAGRIDSLQSGTTMRQIQMALKFTF